MKRKSNEREIKIPVNTMADEVISHLGFVRTSKRVMPEANKRGSRQNGRGATLVLSKSQGGDRYNGKDANGKRE